MAMANQRKIVDARADSDGDITQVLFLGNARFTPPGARFRAICPALR